METNFASRIKKLRNSLNLTQSQFADELNTTQAAFSAYEKGDRTPSLEILTSIAKKYNVSIDWLCGLTNQKSLHGEISTYADAFRLLTTLCSTEVIFDSCRPSKLLDPEIDMCDPANEKMTFVPNPDKNFVSFFYDWKKIYELHSDGTIDYDLYVLWLEKELTKYNKPIDGCPF